MATALPGPLVSGLFDKLKQNHGLKYSKIAEMCGVQRQNITDFRHGRRKFTREMADRLLSARPDEPWVVWLKPLLDYYFSKPDPDRAEKSMASLGLPIPDTIPHSPVGRLPLLDAPVLGDPQVAAAFSGEYAPVTKTVLALVDREYQPYILKVQYDDYALRLRAGDWVLIQQTLEFEKEIMVVEQGGRLSLARRHPHAQRLGLTPKEMEEVALALKNREPLENVYQKRYGKRPNSPSELNEESEWLALESGKSLEGARPVACVACIVLAML